MLTGESRAEQYIREKAWACRYTDDHIILERCPMSGCDNYHFYIHRGGEKDGVWDCKKCGKSGGLWALKEHLGDNKPELTSSKDWANDKKDPLPDPIACHQRLMEDHDVLEYLVDVRGFGLETIKKLKIGLAISSGRKWLVIPYFRQGQIVYAKYRRVPPVLEGEKRFSAPKGHEAPLYNEDALVEGVEEIIFVEGEPDAISCISNGVTLVVGVPGANSKKFDWIVRLDNAKPKRIYTWYDIDKVGQAAAEELARRIMLNTQLPAVLNIKPEPFEKYDGTPGKDANDWWRAGHTMNEFRELKEKAVPFEVRGVVSIMDAFERLEQKLDGMDELRPKYEYPWDDLNRKAGGFEDGDVIDILAAEKIGKTTFAMNILDYVVAKYGENGLFWCMEMPVDRLARKLVSYLTLTDDSPASDVEDAKKRLAAFKAAMPLAKETIRSRKGELFFSDYRPQTAEEAIDILRQAHRRYGIKFVVFDNIQILADLTLKRQDQRTVHISQISKRFKALGIETGMVIFRIVQPKKIRPGEVASHEDADGSSQLSKDCDCTFTLHRTQKAKVRAEAFEAMGYLDEETAMEPHLLTRTSISRYAPGGVCTLYMEGATSRVRELLPDEKGGAKIPVGGLMPMPSLERPVEA